MIPGGLTAGLFVPRPLEVVADFLVGWYRRLERPIACRRRAGTLSDGVSFLADRCFTPKRAFMIRATGWTAYFDNHLHEWVDYSLLAYSAQELGTSNYYFSCKPDGRASFNACRCSNGAAQERQIQLDHDDRWTFEATGEPLPFENLTAYQARRKRDRLTESLLRDYGRALGLPFWEPDFYGSELALLSWGDPPPEAQERGVRRLLDFFKPTRFIDGRKRS